MKELCISFFLIASFSSIIGMETTKSAWVKAHDGKLIFISNPDVIESSNLLKKLSQEHEGSLLNPIILPQAINQSRHITKEDLRMFCMFHGITETTLYKILAPTSYDLLIEATVKLEAPHRFVNLEITRMQMMAEYSSK